MSTDSGSKIVATAAAPELPALVGLRIRKIVYEAPQPEHFRSLLAEPREAVEFLVETDGEVPPRALGPALFVGEVEIDQSEKLGERSWRLLAFDLQALEPGAPIAWGWMRDPPEMRRTTQYRYLPEA